MTDRPSIAPAADRTPYVASLSWEDSRLLVESVVDYAIFMLDTAGHVATWNLGAEKIKGYAASEIIGRHFSAFYPPEDVAAGKPEHELEIAKAAGRVEDEGWRVRKDGTRFWGNVVITALRGERGELRGFGKVTRDLTARRAAEATERELLRERTARSVAEEAEARVRQSEERYKALSQRLEIVLEGVADGITVQDRSGSIVFANSAAARICGFSSPDELLKTPPADVVARFEILDDQGRPFPPHEFPGRRVLAGERSSSVLLHVRERATGHDRWAAVRATAVFDGNDEPELAINIWHDVTAEHSEDTQAKYLAEATAALGASFEKEQMLATLGHLLVPGLADWCSIHLLEGDRLRNVTVAHVDPKKVAIAQDYEANYPPSAAHGRGAFNVARTGETEHYSEITDEMLVQTARDETQLGLLRAVGMKAVLMVPMRARGDSLGVISLIMAESNRAYDSSQITLAEELGRRAGIALENAQLYSAAQEAARAAEEASRAKDEFLATVSHELRTPLSAVLGWSKLLKDRVTDPALAKPLEVIHRNAEAQVKIIDDILDVSRVITGKFKLEAKPTDLVSITRDALDVVRPSAEAKKIELSFEPASDFCLLVADPERIRQVVWNLLSNSVKFTPVDGHIQVRIAQDGSNIELSVRDSGAGIDPTFLPFVFDRFKQADSSTTRRVGGLGLGLALVRHIVELHGGRAAAHSDGLGRGATFSISLPIRAVIPSEPPRASRPTGITPLPFLATLDGVRVLVVDDEPDARDLIAEVLGLRGATIQTCSSAAEGIHAFLHFLPHVLVSDLGMPNEDGYSFIRRVRALPVGANVPALALSAFAREEDNAKALAAGYTAHVGKPVDPDALAAAVVRLARS